MEGEGGGGGKQPQQLIFENVSPATRLLEKRRQMYEVQDALENQKARFAREEETFRKKEEQLRSKDLQLQHQLFRFNKFLQDNEAKRRRAESRAADEAAQIKAREEEIRDLEKQLDRSKQECAKLDDEVTRNMKYEDFLEIVKNSDSNFSEIQDLVTRYETLESAHKDLMNLQTWSDEKIESLRGEYQDYQRETEMQMLAMTNKVGKLQTEREDAGRDRAQLGDTLDEAAQEDSKHSLKFGQILMSVENLYLRCINKRGNVLQHVLTVKEEQKEEIKPGEEDTEEDEDSFAKKKQKAIEELRVILFYLKDFKDIGDVIKKERRNDPSRHKQTVTLEQAKPPEPQFIYEAHEAPRGDRDRGSQSGSAANVSKNRGDTTSGSGGAPAGEA